MRAATAAAGAGAGLASVALHGLALAALLPLFAPLPVPVQKLPSSRFGVQTEQVPERAAPETRPEQAAAPEASGGGVGVSDTGVPQRVAAAVPGDTVRVAAQTGAGARVSAMTDKAAALTAKSHDDAPAMPLAASGAPVAAELPKSGTLGAVSRAGARAPEVRAQALVARAGPVVARAGVRVTPAGARVAAVQAGRPVAETRPAPARIMPRDVPGRALASGAAEGHQARKEATGGARLAQAKITAVAVAGTSAEAAPVAPTPPETEVLRAGLDWSTEAALTLDAQGLSVLAAFLGGQGGDADAVRDAISQVMQGPPCARVQTAFDPATGALELRGHVPEPNMRAPLLAALRGQVGDAFEIRDRTLILPPPQCTVLAGLAATGLVQSDEQHTNPHLVGENAHVREYRFAEGDWLALELTAPDYPAYVYVDYFDAAGQVIHLIPNRFIPLRRHAPAERFSIRHRGEGDPPGPSLSMRITPPFGQDIAVALASNARLFDGLRPVAEPAAPYLEMLSKRLAEKRRADPAFRGEWVYLFVSTHSADAK